MRLLVALTMVLVAATAVAQDPTTSQRTLIMKLPIAAGIAPADMKRLVEAYAGIISGRPGLDAVTAFDVANLLEEASAEQQGLLEQGCEELSCWQLATDAVTSQYVVGGSIGRVGKDLVISLSLIDTDTMRPVGSAVETALDVDGAIRAGPSTLARLFGWEAEQTVSFKLPEGGGISLAVFDLKAADISEETGASLSQVLAAALKDVEGVSVITQDDIRSMLELEAQKQALGCTDEACFAEIGGALGVDMLVVGFVTNLSGRYVVNLRLINGRNAEVSNRVTESFKGERGQLVPAVRFAGRRLLGVEPAIPGVLAVGSSERNAAIFLDDQERGALPMPPIADLSPGRYRVRVAKSGYFDWLSEIYVEPDATTAVWAPLEAEPPAFYETWWFWTGVGALAVGTATFFVLNAMSLPDTELGNVDVR